MHRARLVAFTTCLLLCSGLLYYVVEPKTTGALPAWPSVAGSNSLAAGVDRVDQRTSAPNTDELSLGSESSSLAGAVPGVRTTKPSGSAPVVRAWNPTQMSFPALSELGADPYFNPDGKSLSPEQLKSVSELLDQLNAVAHQLVSETLEMLDPLALQKIAAGDFYDVTDAGVPHEVAILERASIPVSIIQGGRTRQVFLREGEFATLDDVMRRRSEQLEQGFTSLREFFQSL